MAEPYRKGLTHLSWEGSNTGQCQWSALSALRGMDRIR